MDITKHFDAAVRWSWKTALWSLIAVPVWLLLWFLLGFTWSDPPERFHLFASAVLGVPLFVFAAPGAFLLAFLRMVGLPEAPFVELPLAFAAVAIFWGSLSYCIVGTYRYWRGTRSV
jgi:hypothetical protein